jgi:hypothetical protein
MRLDTATDLSNLLVEYGLDGIRPSDLESLEPGQPREIYIRHEKAAQGFAVLYLPTLTAATLASIEYKYLGLQPLLLLGPRINERSAEMYRHIGINYLDQAGNAYLNFGGVLIDVRGRKLRSGTAESATARASGGTNLFSTKRSQVIFALLAWPELIAAPIRALAHFAGVSLGQAQDTLTVLYRTGFLDEPGGRRLRRADELLDRWAVAYPTGLGSPSKQSEFFGDIGHFENPGTETAFVSGESAVSNLLRPETLTIYVDDLSSQFMAANRWRTDRQPNIFVRKKFWKDPTDEGFRGSVTLAPALLVYADLRASGDSRQLEAAAAFRGQSDFFQRL